VSQQRTHITRPPKYYPCEKSTRPPECRYFLKMAPTKQMRAIACEHDKSKSEIEPIRPQSRLTRDHNAMSIRPCDFE